MRDMYMLILLLHVAIAVVMTATTIGVAMAAYANRAAQTTYLAMISSFVGTVLSGIVLVVVAPTGLGRFCAMMTAFTLTTLVVRHYYRRQVVSQS